MGYIFILRHGPTHSNEKLNLKKMYNFCPHIINKLLMYGGVDIIYTSPIERCKDTANIIRSILNIKKKKLIVTKYLRRIDDDESILSIQRRTAEFGYNILNMYKNIVYKSSSNSNIKNKDKNILIISHSSVLKYVIEGIIDSKLSNIYFNTASLTIYDYKNDELIDLNIKWDI